MTRKDFWKNWITWFIIIAIIIYLVINFNNPSPQTNEELVKCIGSKSTLYTQLGCHACETQEKMFGENYQYLNTVDCFYEREKCGGIEATPTWLIKTQEYKGVQSIDKLKELTRC
ncbi:hypothetical protein GOV14_07195 [Candidatus Pacearchaeota archaeon]|nr:hypothetical protein [Candidatus Pacearchaeota archaeon]